MIELKLNEGSRWVPWSLPLCSNDLASAEARHSVWWNVRMIIDRQWKCLTLSLSKCTLLHKQGQSADEEKKENGEKKTTRNWTVFRKTSKLTQLRGRKRERKKEKSNQLTLWRENDGCFYFNQFIRHCICKWFILRIAFTRSNNERWNVCICCNHSQGSSDE